MKRRGFTLIELLVVVAIIAALIAILLPALQNARELARKIVCQNNFRQIWMGFNSYSEEHHGFCPPPYDFSSYWPNGAYLVWYHGKNFDVYPAVGYHVRHRLNVPTDSPIWSCPDSGRIPGMHAYIASAAGAAKFPSISAFWRPEGIGRPAETFLLGDSSHYTLGSGFPWQVGGPVFCHNEGLNLIFIDGHTEWWPGDDWPTSNDHWDYRCLKPFLTGYGRNTVQ